MSPAELEALLVDRIVRHRGSHPDSLGVVMVGARSPGPALGVRCERLGVHPGGGSAWGVRVRDLERALAKVRAGGVGVAVTPNAPPLHLGRMPGGQS